MSSSNNSAASNESSSDGGDYTDLPIILEHQGEAQQENNDEQGTAKVSPNLQNRESSSTLLKDSTQRGIDAYQERMLKNELEPEGKTSLTKSKTKIISTKVFDKETTKAQRVRIK